MIMIILSKKKNKLLSEKTITKNFQMKIVRGTDNINIITLFIIHLNQ